MKRLLYTLVLFTSAVTMRFSSIAQGLDNSFGTGGIVTTNVGFGATMERISAIAIQPDGKIVAVGLIQPFYPNSVRSEFLVIRYNSDGSRDASFGEDGIVKTDFGTEEFPADGQATDVKILNDGSILVAGSVYGNEDNTGKIALALYQPSGDLQMNFGTGGKVFVGATPNGYIDPSFALQGDKIIVAARTNGQNGARIFRLIADGSIDDDFGTNGVIEITASSNFFAVNDVAVLSDNTILVAGGDQVNLSSSSDFVIYKFTADGQLIGKTSTDFDGETDQISNLAIQGDGKIVAAGQAGLKFGIARYNPDGSLDNTFDGDGKQTTVFESDNIYLQFISDIVIQRDGRVVSVGVVVNLTDLSAPSYAVAARYLSNGQLDPCFGNDGKLTVELPGNNDRFSSVAAQADGKIVFGGSSNSLSSYDDFVLARYTSSQPITWYLDADNDGFGDDNNTVVSCTDPSIGEVTCPLVDDPACNSVVEPCAQIPDPLCSPITGVRYVTQGGDCNDNDVAIYPGATEICDNKDNNCNAQIDEGVGPQTWYLDADGDGYGDDNTTQVTCTQPPGQVVKVDPLCIDNPTIPFMCPTKVILWVATGGDCNDNDAAVKPGATEVCDGKDNDCDGQTDEGLPTTTYYIDADGDGYGTGTGIEYCSNPGVGYTSQSGDCNDSDASIHPTTNGTVELCDGIDNDCDGVIDEGCSGKPTLSISDVTVYESEGKAVLTIKLSHITTLQVKVAYSTADGTAVSNKKEKDYKSIGSTMLTIPPGTLSTTITVPVYNDGKAENNEYFYVNLSKPTNCLLGDVSGMVTILDGTPITSARNSMAAPIQNEIREQTEISLQAKAFPNPSSTSFTVQVDGGDGTPVDMRIFNSMGQVVKALRSADRTLRFGDELQKGIYILEVRQGSNRKTIKLIKQ